MQLRDGALAPQVESRTCLELLVMCAMCAPSESERDCGWLPAMRVSMDYLRDWKAHIRPYALLGKPCANSTRYQLHIQVACVYVLRDFSANSSTNDSPEAQSSGQRAACPCVPSAASCNAVVRVMRCISPLPDALRLIPTLRRSSEAVLAAVSAGLAR